MPLQNTLPISFGDIVGEFGGSAPHNLTEYFRGGAFVPDTAANAGIPTAPPVSFDNYLGGDASVGSVVMPSTIDDSDSNPGSLASAGFTFTNDGRILAWSNGSLLGHWWSEGTTAGIGDNYEVRFINLTGDSWDADAAVEDDWIALTSDRTWRILVTAIASPAFKNNSCTFQIRPTGGAVADSSSATSHVDN